MTQNQYKMIGEQHNNSLLEEQAMIEHSLEQEQIKEFEKKNIEIPNILDIKDQYIDKIENKNIEATAFIENYINELGLHLNGSNANIIKDFLDIITASTDASKGLGNIRHFLTQYIKHPSLDNIQGNDNETEASVIKRKVESELGYMVYLKLTKKDLIAKYCKTIKSTEESKFKKDRFNRNETRAQNYNWSDDRIKEAEKVSNDEIINYFIKMQNDFGIFNIVVPSYMPKSHIYLWLQDFKSDLENLSEFLKIPKILMCPFNIVLAQNSRNGRSSYGIQENTIYLDDINTSAFIHEWVHFFDYRMGQYFSKIFKYYHIDKEICYWSNLRTESYMTHMPCGNALTVVDFIKEYVMQSPFYEKAINLDKKTKDEYWSKDYEIFARTFEAWIYSHLKNKLNLTINQNITDNSEEYPTGSILNFIVKFLDQTWDELKIFYGKSFDLRWQRSLLKQN